MTARFLLTAATMATVAATVPFQTASAQRQEREVFTWSDAFGSGRTLRIRNLNGSVTVAEASGNRVEVVATARWRRGDPSVVRFDKQTWGPRNDNVVICALWSERSRCDANRDDTGRVNLRNNDVVIDFKVMLPRGANIGLYIVNGSLTVGGASGEVDAVTVNGDVSIASSGGAVRGETVNGNVAARLTRVDGARPTSLATTNGNVAAEVPSAAGFDVELETVNGSVRSDFPLSLSGRIDPRHLRAHIGPAGGPRFSLTTVNGNVDLKTIR